MMLTQQHRQLSVVCSWPPSRRLLGPPRDGCSASDTVRRARTVNRDQLFDDED